MHPPQTDRFFEETRINLAPLQVAMFVFAAGFEVVFGSRGFLDETLPTALLLLVAVLASWFLQEES